MRSMTVALLAVALASASASRGPTRAAPATPTPARAESVPAARPPDSGEWPATPAGEIARGWTEAFSAGETAMREFLSKHLSPESLAKRGMSQRMETYRGNRE